MKSLDRRLIALLLSTLLVASPALGAQVCRLSGIYGPGGRGVGPPPTDTLALPFVDGLILYPDWATLEPAPFVYDFSALDDLIGLVQPAGKRVGLAVRADHVPQHILDLPGVATYLRRETGAVSCTTATLVPWDPTCQARWADFAQALANHLVPDWSRPGNPLTPLSEHPAVSHVLCEVPGSGAIRDLGGCLVNAPGYERAGFLDSVIAGITAMQDRFPTKYTYIFFFNVNDGGSPPLTDEILARFHATFDGVIRPRLGLMQENLSCDAPPIGTGTNPLHLEQDLTFTMFQMTQAWVSPHQNPQQTDECLVTTVPGDRSTAISGPEVGIAYAFDNFQARYFEPYQADLLHAGFADEFAAWHAILHATDPLGDADGDGLPDDCDACPLDPTKSVPGQCGCGVAERPGCLGGGPRVRYVAPPRRP